MRVLYRIPGAGRFKREQWVWSADVRCAVCGVDDATEFVTLARDASALRSTVCLPPGWALAKRGDEAIVLCPLEATPCPA